MSDYVAYFNFGAGAELGPFPLRTAVPDEYLCSETFHAVVSQWRISFIPTTEYLAARAAATGDTLVRILQDEVLQFKGRVPPTDGWTSNGVALDGSADLSDVELEVLDYSSWLERTVTAEDDVAWEDNYLCNPADPAASIVHRLFTLCGISGSLFVPVVSDTTVLHGFSLDEGANIGDELDELLWENGLVRHWVVDHFELYRWLNEIPTPTIDLDEDVVMVGLKTERIEREADGVEVKWYALKDKADCLLYMADLPFGSDNQRSGYPIQAGLLWPEEANVAPTWWDYEDTALAYTYNATLGQKVKTTDFSQIVMTKNRRVDASFDAGVVAEGAPVLYNKTARVAFKNPTAVSLNIYYCNIYGDTIYRGAENSVCKNTIAGPKKTATVTAKYLHILALATRLACALADQYGTACWRHTATSETCLALGTIARLIDPYSGLTTTVMIVKRSYAPETELYTYALLSISAVTIAATASYQAVLPEPKTASDDVRIQVSKTVTSPELSISVASLSRARSGILTPAAITIASAYRNGAAYAGRFAIAISADGLNYTNAYVSEVDESSKTFAVPATIEIEGTTYFVISVRVRLFEAGGVMATRYDEALVGINAGSDNTPIYWQSVTELPTSGMMVNDYLFDARTPAYDASTAPNGGGVIRYWTGTTWAVATNDWPLYGAAWAATRLDLVAWATKNGETVTAVRAIISSLVTNEGFVAELASLVIKSAQVCSVDGVTPRLQLDLANAIYESFSDDKTQSIKLVDSILRSVEGANALEHQGQSFVWKKTGATEIELARLKYDDATALVRVGLPGDVPSSGIAAPVKFAGSWLAGTLSAGASKAISTRPERCALQVMPDGRTRVVYANGTNAKLAELFISENNVWGAGVDRIDLDPSGVTLIPLPDGRTRCLFISSQTLYEVIIASDGSWGAYSPRITQVAGSHVDAMALPSGVTRIIYESVVSPYPIMEVIVSAAGIWGEPVARVSQSYGNVALCLLSDGRTRVTYRAYSTSYRMEVIIASDGVWGTPVQVSTTAYSYAVLELLPNGTMRFMALAPSTRYVTQIIISSDGVWGSPTTIVSSACDHVALSLLPNGSTRLVYGQSAVLYEALSTDAYSSIPIGTFFTKVGMGVVERGTDSNGEYDVLGDGTILRLAPVGGIVSAGDYIIPGFGMPRVPPNSQNGMDYVVNFSSLTKVAEYKCPFSGTINIKFKMANYVSGISYTTYGRVYKNGVAIGTLRSNSSTTVTTYIESNVTVSPGDLIQLYMSSDTTYRGAGVAFALCHSGQGQLYI